MTRHILIVEDVKEKRDLLLRTVSQRYDITDDWAQSIASAYSLVVTSKSADLILLDMAFASQHSLNRLQANGTAGLELLQYMRARQIQVPVIVATSHDSFTDGANLQFQSIAELDRYLKAHFPNNYVGIIRVQHNGNDWNTELFSLLESAFR